MHGELFTRLPSANVFLSASSVNTALCVAIPSSTEKHECNVVNISRKILTSLFSPTCPHATASHVFVYICAVKKGNHVSKQVVDFLSIYVTSLFTLCCNNKWDATEHSAESDFMLLIYYKLIFFLLDFILQSLK